MPADIFSPFSGTPVSEEVLLAAAKVRFLVLDVDGVCTDGKLYFQENGHPIKCFNAQDGIGIKTALLSDLGIGIITGRNDPCVLARMSQLGVKDYYAGFEAKLPKLEAIRQKYGLQKEEMAYLGDDWIDLDPMRSVGMPMAVANAVAQVKKEALYVTAARGGEGAVREAVEFLLAARRDGSACIRSTASLNASESSPSQRKPFSPCLTYSTVPRFRAAATGTPHAIASSAAIPRPSRSDGNRNRSAPWRSTSRSLRNPRNVTWSSRPYSLTVSSSAGRCGPSPQMT